MPGGRPTDYKPEYCKRVIAMGKRGKSPAQMASALGVARQTIDNWGEKHPKFLDALYPRANRGPTLVGGQGPVCAGR